MSNYRFPQSKIQRVPLIAFHFAGVPDTTTLVSSTKRIVLIKHFSEA